ncbi:hypothetical protein D1151_08800 [Emergencia sp. 1XD21-10]|nr:hypothetical protein [Emergencia sp. 1XD21-10]
MLFYCEKSVAMNTELLYNTSGKTTLKNMKNKPMKSSADREARRRKAIRPRPDAVKRPNEERDT